MAEDPQRPLAPSTASTAVPSTLRPSSPSSNSLRNPFATPQFSRSTTSFGSSNGPQRLNEHGQPRYFHSRRVHSQLEKPWLEKKDSNEIWVTVLPILGILIGLGISAALVWEGVNSVVKHNYCLVLDDDFSGGLDKTVWNYEIELGGFGNQQFEMTTDSSDNVFVDDSNNLNIRATLQDSELLEKDNIIDLLDLGKCTSTKYTSCVAATNTTTGNSSVVNPVLSGRINTKGTRSIKYGRVEVTARMPEGDWLWPAIWMMPEHSAYGPWPASGEIDIAESRGNNHTYEQGGNNIVSSALHWGPAPGYDAWWRTNGKRAALHTTYSSRFHTFGLEWSERYLFTYVNSRLLQVRYVNFDTRLWERGNFPAGGANGTFLRDPWRDAGGVNAPFDRRFYLILNLAVGGRNGWFEDSKSGKPWLDGSDAAPKDFWNARDSWLPTWKKPEMQVSRVTMWQQCNGDEL